MADEYEESGFIDPRIVGWLKEDKQTQRKARAAELGKLRAEMEAARAALVAASQPGADCSTPAWRDLAAAAVAASTDLGAFLAADLGFADKGLEVLRGISVGDMYCVSLAWFENYVEDSKLELIIQEGKLRVDDAVVRFDCDVRMGGYKFRDMEDVEDNDKCLEFTPGTVDKNGKPIDFEDTLTAVGDFEEARAQAPDQITSDDIFSQGEEWDSMSDARAWAKIDAAIIYAPGSALWAADESPTQAENDDPLWAELGLDAKS